MHIHWKRIGHKISHGFKKIGHKISHDGKKITHKIDVGLRKTGGTLEKVGGTISKIASAAEAPLSAAALVQPELAPLAGLSIAAGSGGSLLSSVGHTTKAASKGSLNERIKSINKGSRNVLEKAKTVKTNSSNVMKKPQIIM